MRHCCFWTSKMAEFQTNRLKGRGFAMASQNGGGSMGTSSRPVLLSAHPVDMDVMSIIEGGLTPKSFTFMKIIFWIA